MDNFFIKAIKNRRRRKETKNLGVTGSVTTGGFLQDNETNADMTGARKWIAFSETLVNVGIVGAGIRYFLNLIARAKLTAVPPEDSGDKGVKAAKFVNEVLADMETPWARVLRRTAMYKFHGFSVQEWTAKMRDDGFLGLEDIAPRPQSTIERWDITKAGRVKGCWQRSLHDGKDIYLPRSKIIYVVDDSLSDSPEGLGILRHIIPHAKLLQVYESIEAIGLETDLRGVPIGRVPTTIMNQAVKEGALDEADATAAKQVMTDFITNHIKSRDTGMILDSMTYQTADEKGNPSNIPLWAVEILQNNSTALPDAANAINRLTHTIARLIGVEHLLLGTEKGSFALSRDKSHNFFMVIDSALSEIATAMQKDVVDRLWQINGFDDKVKPKLVPETSRFRDIEQITKALSDLSSAGVQLSPDDPIVGWLRDLMGAPRLEKTGIVTKPKEDEDGGNDDSSSDE